MHLSQNIHNDNDQKGPVTLKSDNLLIMKNINTASDILNQRIQSSNLQKVIIFLHAIHPVTLYFPLPLVLSNQY